MLISKVRGLGVDTRLTAPIGRPIVRLWKRLGTVSPGKWLVLYFCSIFLFAGLYTVRCSEFVDNSIVQELRTRRASFAAQLSLVRELDRDLAMSRPESISGWHLGSGGIEVLGVEAPGRTPLGREMEAIGFETIYADVAVPVVSDDSSAEARMGVRVGIDLRGSGADPADTTFVLAYSKLIRAPRRAEWKVRPAGHSDIWFESNAPTPPDSLVCRELAAEWFVPLLRSGHFLRLSKPLARKLWDFANMFEGISTNPAEAFPRMLYLSAITITTVGFGDVIPISDLARLMVALEAVVGVVIAGLFVNSVATQSNK